ncbi:DUF6710 family protein [Citrobacter freundii]|uniref:DUF6710 family protein n=1 Tax=Citrobacter freundii TaxID=546 RepID=UPI003C6F94CC
MGSCAAPSAKGDDKFITTDYLQQCQIIWAMDYTHMKSLRLAAEDFPLALATAKILPWPWGESSYRSALADIGSAKGNPWVQDINHRVTL